MGERTLTPEVNHAQEFIEIALDFANPLDLVREAISNAFDAGAKRIRLGFDMHKANPYDRGTLIITIEDNGSGMDLDGLQSFFDLGNSLRRQQKHEQQETCFIGEKGHGTKVYFNSNRIEVKSLCNKTLYTATMEAPYRTLTIDRKIPDVNVQYEPTDDDSHWSKITITGYNDNNEEKYSHAILEDHIKWFTKMGSIEMIFGKKNNKNVVLELKGVDDTEYHPIVFGHTFPSTNSDLDSLLDTYLVDAPKYYCYRKVVNRALRRKPSVRFQAVFSVEGNQVKYNSNPMIRHQGYPAPPGAYTVQERYGLWICKDFIPVQRKNEWITQKGNEYTKFHAFVNCQELKLTANRSSIENSDPELIDALREEVAAIYEEITSSTDWEHMKYLEEESESFNTIKKEKNLFKLRKQQVNRAKVAYYKGLQLVEPQKENGVFSIFMQLSQLEPELFPFSIIDYDTHFGIDVIVKERNDLPLNINQLYYVEFKNILSHAFNHSFENIHSIVCWDTKLRHGEEISDITGKKKKRRFTIVPAETGGYTQYFLDDPHSARRIEVFILKTYLKDKLNIDFRPRTADECY